MTNETVPQHLTRDQLAEFEWRMGRTGSYALALEQVMSNPMNDPFTSGRAETAPDAALHSRGNKEHGRADDVAADPAFGDYIK